MEPVICPVCAQNFSEQSTGIVLKFGRLWREGIDDTLVSN